MVLHWVALTRIWSLDDIQYVSVAPWKFGLVRRRGFGNNVTNLHRQVMVFKGRKTLCKGSCCSFEDWKHSQNIIWTSFVLSGIPNMEKNRNDLPVNTCKLRGTSFFLLDICILLVECFSAAINLSKRVK